MTREELNEIHGRLCKYREFYYNKDISLISDYAYDMLEKKYKDACDEHNIPEGLRVSNFVGFSETIPKSIE